MSISATGSRAVALRLSQPATSSDRNLFGSRVRVRNRIGQYPVLAASVWATHVRECTDAKPTTRCYATLSPRPANLTSRARRTAGRRTACKARIACRRLYACRRSAARAGPLRGAAVKCRQREHHEQ